MGVLGHGLGGREAPGEAGPGQKGHQGLQGHGGEAFEPLLSKNLQGMEDGGSRHEMSHILGMSHIHEKLWML